MEMTSKVKRVKVKSHERSKVKFDINVKEKAGGLMPTSSCFVFGMNSYEIYFGADTLYFSLHLRSQTRGRRNRAS